MKTVSHATVPQNTPEQLHRPRLLSSRRITITVPQSTFEALEQRCGREGRSLSNLAAFLLEFQLVQA